MAAEAREGEAPAEPAPRGYLVHFQVLAGSRLGGSFALPNTVHAEQPLRRFLGIDLGTSFFKGAVLDPATGAIDHVTRRPCPEPVAGLPEGRHELDPREVLDAVRRLLDDLMRVGPDAVGLVLCGQMHGLVFTDQRGQPLSNIITWKDQRVLEPLPGGEPTTYFAALSALLTPEEHARVGREVRVGLPIANLFWLARNNQLKAGTHVVSLPDFVAAILCGVEPTTDATNASAAGLYDVDAENWDCALIDKLGLSELRWPRVRKFGEAVGIVEIGGRRATSFTPVGDYQCALAGAHLQPGELSLNISTGSQVSILSDSRRTDDGLVRPYFDGQWLRTIVQIPAGRSLALLVDLLTEIPRSQGLSLTDPWDSIDLAISGIETTDLEVDLSFYAGALGDRGGIANLREGNAMIGHLFLAAFQAMARNYAACAHRLSPAAGWDRVVFSGGLAQRFPRLRAEILRELGVADHRLCDAKEDALLGLLNLAKRCAVEQSE